MRRSTLIVSVGLWLVGTAPAVAQTEQQGQAGGAAPSAPATAADQPTGSGPPTFASSGPFSFSASSTGDLIGNPAGGLARRLKLLSKSTLGASFDGNDGDRPGWSGQASIQLIRGGHISAANVGDIQGVDNIEAPPALRLYELWLSKQWHDGQAGIKLGLTDLNVDFDTQQVAALFLNSSDGVGGEFGHSGLNGPSIYPTTALALSGFVKPDQNWTFRAGLFDGLAGSLRDPSAFVAIHLSPSAGALLVAQAERSFSAGMRIEFGGWLYSSPLDDIDEASPRKLRHLSAGLYGLIEGPIFTSETRSVSGWIRAGIGNPEVQRIGAYTGGGLVVSGLLPSRPEDQAGISLNHAILRRPLPGGGRSAETAVEATYKTQLKDWLSVQPDAQYVIRPNGDPHDANAVVVGLRFSVNLTRNLLRHIRG